MDYKNTINLPKTSFPMKADLPHREPQMLACWQAEKIYETLLEQRQNCPEFILHDGPPFANGDAHMGHALNMTLKDIVLKSKNMAGYRVPFIPGWDCHGLPIEHKVMKELSSSANTDPIQIRKRCTEYAHKYINIQRKQFQRLGVFGDWENPYLTMDPVYEAEILRVFASLIEKKLVYQSLRPVYWSTGCQTALAEAEVEYQNRKDTSIYVKFELDSASSHCLGIKNGSILIWTTTPWTLPANLAVAIHPKIQYILVEFNSEHWILAKDRLNQISEISSAFLQVIREIPGRELTGLIYHHPFLKRTGKIVTADFVTTESGTGLVHIAPGHGQDDYQVGLREGLELLSPVDDQGRLTTECSVDSLVGQYVFDANDQIVEILKNQNKLLFAEPFIHSYPHCWRSKTPIIFRSVKQWFIRVDDFRQKALAAIDQVKWVPAWGKNRIHGTVETRPDWCISRQRTWGVPIPVFYTEKDQPLLEENIVRTFADIVEKEGTDIWFSTNDEKMSARLGLPKGLRKGSDTLDVWIDSGTSHAAVLRKRLQFPADLYLEGSDQHRGWFQSSLLTSVALTGAPPFRQVLTNGFVVDLDGKKLSKSNTYQKPIDLMTFVQKHGADVLRLWVASEDFRNDVPFSEEIFTHVAETYRTIRNTLRILLGNLYDYDPLKHFVDEEKLTLLDRYILLRLQETLRQVLNGYEQYEFHTVYHAINRFCRVELSSFYVDVTKDRMYCDALDSPRRRSAQTAMREIVETLCLLLAPIMPFTMDEAWRALGYSKSIHLQTFPKTDKYQVEEKFLQKWTALLDLRDKANLQLESLRRDKKIGKSLEAIVRINKDTVSEWDSETLAEVFNVSQIHPQSVDTVEAVPAVGEKCARCWKILPEVGSDNSHPTLCERCINAVNPCCA